MDEQRALQVSQNREMVEVGAQAMLQQCMRYLQDAVNAPHLRKENEGLRKELDEVKQLLEAADRENRILGHDRANATQELEAVRSSRDTIAQHRDRLLGEAAQLNEKLRRIRHSMDTMRGIMESNLAA